jgi:macrolide-specific efflux system membrane fusion protein
VNANQSAPTILIVAQVDTMTVKASISEADVTSVKPGQKVYFTILGEPDRRWHTTLRSIEPATDSISTSSTSSTSSSSTSTTSATAIYYNGKLDVPNPDHLLRISMTATVHIVRSAARNALTIPAGALGPRGRMARPRCRWWAGRPAAAARVKIGINNSVSAQVLDGLREGEQVVLGNAATARRPMAAAPAHGPADVLTPAP